VACRKDKKRKSVGTLGINPSKIFTTTITIKHNRALSYRIFKGFATLSLQLITAITLFITKIYFQFLTLFPQLKILGENLVL
jgi:hypothetical protein